MSSANVAVVDDRKRVKRTRMTGMKEWMKKNKIVIINEDKKSVKKQIESLFSNKLRMHPENKINRFRKEYNISNGKKVLRMELD
jgi:hypothetical protein